MQIVPFLSRRRRPLVPVLRLSGMIASGARGGALNDAGLAATIERAFRRGRPAAVALIVNSPGGSPVQSALIAARIRRLAEERKLPVHAFVEDVAASGGYWLACAADDIWLDASSITGSIGVISAGFGLQDFIARHGIERRVHTAGESKSMLDMFRPEDPRDIARLERMLTRMHATFADHVRARRGDRLDATRDLFTGEVFVGAEAVEAGLADGLAHPVDKLKALYGPHVRLRLHAQRKPFLGRLGRAAADQALVALEERAGFARFGL